MTNLATAVVEEAKGPTPPGPRHRPSTQTLAVVAVIAFALGFLIVGHQRITMAFGDSHDGRNGTQWGLGSRDLRTDGPVRSHMGADLTAGAVRAPYTDHPPLIYAETAAVETLGGEHPWSTRLPAWLGSIAAIGLCLQLLRRCGLSPAAAAIGTTLGLGCPMFGAYGIMNDPWILGLPWGIAILLLWQRRRIGVPTSWWLISGVAFVGAWTSWVNVLELGLIGVAELAVRLRRRRPDVLLPIAVPTVAAVALTLGWVAWSHGGSISSLLHNAGTRSGGASNGLSPSVVLSMLKSYWVDTFTPWQLLLAVPVIAAAWLDERSRPVLAVALGTVVLWIAVFSDGAAHHDYWGYWMVLPLAIGIGVGADILLRARSRNIGRVAVAAATLVGIVGFVVPGTIPRSLIRGSKAGAVLVAARATMPADQPYVWYLGSLIQIPYWVSYPFHRPGARLPNLATVDRLASTRPDDLVLVASYRLTPDLVPADPSAPCRAGVPRAQQYAVETAATLDRALRTGACPAVAASTTLVSAGPVAEPPGLISP